MRILITGSSGQLGSEIARQLTPAHEVIGLDLVPGKWTTRLGSLLDKPLLTELVAGVDAVIHTASLHARHLPDYTKQAFIDTNISGTLNLLELATRYQLEKVVYTSTTSLYGFGLVPEDRAVWVTEELAPRPRDIYDITKLAAEELCQIFALEHNLKVLCLRTGRFFNEAAELQARHRLYRGLDVRDAARAHVLAVTNTTLDFEIFNIAAGYPYREDEMAKLLNQPLPILKKYYPGIEALFEAKGWELPTRIDRVYVSAKAEKLLGYRPEYNFEQYLVAAGDQRK